MSLTSTTTIQNKGSEYPGKRNPNTASQPIPKQSNLGARFVKNWVKKHPSSLQNSPS
jgi:hypothetical protein